MNIDSVAAAITQCGETDEPFYLSTPYSNYPAGRDAACLHAQRIAGELMQRGVIVYSPIAHHHPIDTICRIGENHAFWMRQCKYILLRCRGMIVAKLPSWDTSQGVDMEISWAAEHALPTFMMDVGDIVRMAA